VNKNKTTFEIVKYLKKRGRPASSIDICKNVLRMSGGGMEFIDKLITKTLSGNSEVFRDGQGMWHWKPSPEPQIFLDENIPEDCFTVFKVVLYHSSDNRSVPVGISAIRLESGKTTGSFLESFYYLYSKIPSEYYTEIGLPFPATPEVSNPPDVLARFISFCHNAFLVCYHLNPHFRMLSWLYQHYCFDSLEIPVISVRKMGERFFAGKKFVHEETLVSQLSMSHIETHEEPRKTETLATLFLELANRLKKHGLTDDVSIYAFQFQESGIELDYDRLAFTTDYFITLPEIPGVYLMEDNNGKVFYVGKAKNLARRIRSHFLPVSPEPDKQKIVVENLYDLSFETCGSELEALLKELYLIHKLNPSLNRQFIMHERTLSYSIPEDFAVILPSVDKNSREIYLVIRNKPVYSERISINNPDFQNIRKIVKTYFLPRKSTGNLPSEEEMKKHIVLSWVSREWDNIRTISVRDTGGTKDFLRLLKMHLQSPEPIDQKLIIQ